MPHAPQFELFVERFAHAVPQTDSPRLQTQLPFLQTWPAVQTAPHAPQFVALLDVSTHTPLQLVVPAPQLLPPEPTLVQAPDEHVSPSEHA